ncbi:hypothetical protein BRADI_3g38191v3 [Brachypodium distachyon]|uniref:Uncharacterized protein n=1 Tax=Brachypodium distachyon TaxID=15368 RepID=A0A0Q3JK08_BRADI|nr:hypothetical protein BRADI_3g38191v3 [Brachypodium distachyon]
MRFRGCVREGASSWAIGCWPMWFRAPCRLQLLALRPPAAPSGRPTPPKPRRRCRSRSISRCSPRPAAASFPASLRLFSGSPSRRCAPPIPFDLSSWGFFVCPGSFGFWFFLPC